MSGSRRGRSAFAKTIARSIRGSLGRFLAIMGIVALGCGFYAGLQMCGPDMRAAADDLYDGTNLYDIRLVSTLGFTDADVDRVAAAVGKDGAGTMPARSCDVMARLGSEQLAMRMSSLDAGVAAASKETGASVVLSADDGYLNRLFLREGSWPQGAAECVVCADKEVAGIQVGDTIEVLYGTSDLDDVLRERTFTVVGKVSASAYPYTGSFGSTTLGSGMIGEYAYVSPEAFVGDMPYTEIYVRAAGAEAEQSGSDAYQDVVDKAEDLLQNQKGVLAQARLADIRSDAQAELDDARAEYEEQKADAKRELADAQAELDEAAEQLADGERQLADGQKEYDNGVAAYDAQRRDALSQLAAAQQKIDAGRQELQASSADLEAAKAQAAQGRQAYEAGLAELLSQVGANDLAGARSKLEAQLSQAQTGVESLSAARQSEAQIADGKAQAAAGTTELLGMVAGMGLPAGSLAEAEAALGQAISATTDPQQAAALQVALGQVATLKQTQDQLDGAEQQLLAGLAAQGIQAADATVAVDAIDAQTEQAQAGIAQAKEALAAVAKLEESKAALDAADAQIQDGQKKLAAGQAELDAGQATLNSQRSEALAVLAQAQNKLAQAKAQLVSSAADLASGKADYEDGLASYQDAKATSDAEFADAERELADAQAEIDDLEAPDIYLLDRSQSEGAMTYDADSRRMDSIADVFPLIFFLVAALVALTTMTRMVDDDRIEIGTYKALGYSKARIASKYLVYAGVASVVGAAVGIAVLSQVLPVIVTSAYSIIYTVPLHPVPLPIHWGIALAASGLGVGVTLLATYAAVVASLRETPATLMLPRAPAAGKRILLERVGPLWRRLSFSWKVTCRNLFRYKRRLAMTVIGISGCTALLLVGFGLHDAIWDIIDCQYGPIVHYDTTVGLDANAGEDEVAQVEDYLASTGDVSGIVRVQQENMQAGSAASGLEPMRVQVIIPRAQSEIESVITFRNRLSGEPISLDADAVVVTEKLSLKYGIQVGDEVLLYDQDDIGNVVGEGHPLTVTGVAENYVGNLVYVGRDAWARVDEDEPVFSTILASTAADDAIREKIANRLHDFADVSTVIFSDETINLYRNMLSVVDMIVVVLIVSAGLLAFIVLYNLTNINIGERVREIASLKVLGFTKGEVYAYIFREIALLAVLGDLLGMVFGTYLETFVATTAEVDYVMFGRTIHPMSYCYGFALTLVFTGLILLVMRHKLDRVNMVESLKSVE